MLVYEAACARRYPCNSLARETVRDSDASRIPADDIPCKTKRPQVPLYLLGHKMMHCYPYVPVGGEMAVNCAILSYNGTVYFGFSGDTHAAPDLRKLEKLLQECFVELRDAVGLRPPQKKKAARRRRVGPEGCHWRWHSRISGGSDYQHCTDTVQTRTGNCLTSSTWRSP